MNISKRQNSAFYAGATRYGGSAATAKRREATRQHFFDIKEIPSTSRPFDQSYYVQSYKIDSNDIIRRQQAVPQLTTSAKRILNWIEENSTPTNGETPLAKRNKFRAHRFNPMKVIPRRAQVERKAVALNQSNLMTPSLTQIPKSTSTRFTSPKFSGPVRDIAGQECEKKSFASPRDTRGAPQEIIKKRLVEPPAPKALKASPPTAATPTRATAVPPAAAAPAPAPPSVEVGMGIGSLESKAAQATTQASPILPKLSNTFAMPAFTSAPTPAVTSAPTQAVKPGPTQPATPAPMMSTQSQTPTVATSIPTTPQAASNQSNLMTSTINQTPSFFSQPGSLNLPAFRPSTPQTPLPMLSPVTTPKTSSPFTAPPSSGVATSNQSNLMTTSVTQIPKSTSTRFISPKFSGPLRDIAEQECEKKSFASPRDTRGPSQETTKKPLVEPPAPKAPEASPPTAATPATAAPACSTAAAAAPAPLAGDVEMDIDSSESNAAQAPAPASSILPPQSNTFAMPAFTSAPAQAVTPSPMMSTQSQTPTAMTSVPTTPQVASNQSNLMTPNLNQTPSFFSPPGSLNLPAFTPSTPQTTLPMLSPVTTPTTSNPFAPPPSSGMRNRKILRGARRLHR